MQPLFHFSLEQCVSFLSLSDKKTRAWSIKETELSIEVFRSKHLR